MEGFMASQDKSAGLHRSVVRYWVVLTARMELVALRLECGFDADWTASLTVKASLFQRDMQQLRNVAAGYAPRIELVRSQALSAVRHQIFSSPKGYGVHQGTAIPNNALRARA
jgi:hypothetical protein